ncbi:hypothetical protein RHMOL_Rhmol08G0177800 [Rhododendron molle]|uniref:Uncharacterized protein n=1 Tax=Rhododendron molle TaxID=49168 RepID=A0ACC0MQY8_RHOML|nr:hypothetical protein RHMOL_Rhmol08G0177800 [Rhododendron molle]
MFARTVNDEEVESIIEGEGLRRVPIYFYDPLAPTDDYWPIDDVNNTEVEVAREEEFADNDPLDEISLKLLFDEGVTNDEIRLIHPITDSFGNWCKEVIPNRYKRGLNMWYVGPRSKI